MVCYSKFQQCWELLLRLNPLNPSPSSASNASILNKHGKYHITPQKWDGFVALHWEEQKQRVWLFLFFFNAPYLAYWGICCNVHTDTEVLNQRENQANCEGGMLECLDIQRLILVPNHTRSNCSSFQHFPSRKSWTCKARLGNGSGVTQRGKDKIKAFNTQPESGYK